MVNFSMAYQLNTVQLIFRCCYLVARQLYKSCFNSYTSVVSSILNRWRSSIEPSLIYICRSAAAANKSAARQRKICITLSSWLQPFLSRVNFNMVSTVALRQLPKNGKIFRIFHNFRLDL